MNKYLFPFLLILAPLPFMLMLAHCYEQHKTLTAAEKTLDSLKLEADKRLLYEKKLAAYEKQKKTADPLYVLNHLSTLSFLEKERTLLQEHRPNETTYKLLEAWDNSNHLVFNEAGELTQPVTINSQDVQHILNLIEGAPTSTRPPLIISDFHLSKTAVAEGIEAFSLRLNLLTP